ncbi:MAG TPA: hypothetical protein VNS10_09550 [Gemmatimonadaceae bacterium]|nr:hypothetical protein [Gemmatimonadaceae bacterium]
MRRTFSPVLSLAAAMGVLALAACSDGTTTPSALRPSLSGPSFTVGPTANVGPVQLFLKSSSTTQYCGYNAALNATFADAGCVAATDLMAALAVYNPGWSAPLTTAAPNSQQSSWIGHAATDNQYLAAVGTYKFNTTFTVDAGVTSPVLNVSTLSDNLVAVYLNGVLLGQQPVADCITAGSCNWQTPFVVSGIPVIGSNTLTVYLTNTRIKYGTPGFPGGTDNCLAEGPQTFGEAGFGTPFNVPTPQRAAYVANPAAYAVTCLNPTGLDFVGTVSWVNPVTTWCSPGFWKNHEELWTSKLSVLYSSIGSWRAPLGNKAPTSGAGSNPTLQQVIENPQIYGGPATNSVADYLSNFFFGTPIGSGIESCPGPDFFTAN